MVIHGTNKLKNLQKTNKRPTEPHRGLVERYKPKGGNLMSTRERVYKLIDNMTDEQLRAFLMLFGEYSEPNEETLKAIAEVEDMKKNPDKYKAYDNINDMMRDLLE